jgi:hypothetical protein
MTMMKKKKQRNLLKTLVKNLKQGEEGNKEHSQELC